MCPSLINPNIKLIRIREHAKASEKYIDVDFRYPEVDMVWAGTAPIQYRRLGLFLEDVQEICSFISNLYTSLKPKNATGWRKHETAEWKKTHQGKTVTKPFFDVLLNFKWNCVDCKLPKNRNWARRIQDIKEMGYLLGTDTKLYCGHCKRNTTQIILIPMEKGNVTGYEIVTLDLKKKIIKTLKNKNAFENKVKNISSLLPDHKFPEIRWDKETKEDNISRMTENEIKDKFQLLDNQRNLEKREVCRRCFQTGKRGTPYGINYFYKGDADWPIGIPKCGKGAESGCVGCGWYDIEKWREELNNRLS